MPKLSILILTKNESANLPGCLASIQGVDEIVVVDDLSEDDTAALARAAGATVVERKFDTFSGQRNFIQPKAGGDWIFHLDADERFSPGLLDSIRRHMELWPGVAGRVIRHNFAFGRRHRFGVLKPDWVTRLFPRGSVTWLGAVHERPVFDGPVRLLPGHLDHFTYTDWAQHQLKMDHYAEHWAEAAWLRGKRAGPVTPWLRAGFGFLKMLILNLGLLGGPAAWTLGLGHVRYTFAKYRRLAELSARPPET
ncbi:MAG: glycosyltransferase family 2 protein [Candidatus Adiutrix sp.]|jgi:glycosyltransferase involved in cell wall biosynthesis|nr:glycosyltransferase family 2 protein [Candidatus Adiutrix sp.]